MIRLFIASRNYSSWSLRAWLVLSRCGVQFEEVVIPLGQPDTAARIRPHSPSGKVPLLEFEGIKVWDSLAIAETLAERYPMARLWPANTAARARARSVSAEMHSGFMALRRELPMNLRARRHVEPSDDARRDIARVLALWGDCRASNLDGGPWLFGAWSIADAMFAPVVTRFVTYAVALDDTARAYVDTVLADPAMHTWAQAAQNELEVVAASEVGTPLH